MEAMYPKCSGLDVHKRMVEACIMVSDDEGGLKQERQQYGTCRHRCRTFYLDRDLSSP